MIFAASGSKMPVLVASMATTAVLLGTTVVGALLINRFGRKTLLNVSAGGMSVCVFVLAIYFTIANKYEEGSDEAKAYSAKFGTLPLISLMAFFAVFSIGWGPIVWMLVPEITPSKARNFVTSMSTCFNWTLVFLITLSFPKVVAWVGIQGGFFFFGVWAAIAIPFCMFFLPETKGKTFDELEHLFD